LKGKIRISDDFDDENEEINNLFYGTHKWKFYLIPTFCFGF
jgi:hypothetical protein